ncbi:hypothetical protein P7C70_g1795, partial [Phenoliferia sp. Uapishka_3]
MKALPSTLNGKMNAQPTFQVLRIKRKRDGQAPLDAFVLDDRQNKRRKSAGPGLHSVELPGIKAKTLPIDSFDTANKTRLVGDRIAATFLAEQLARAQSALPSPIPSQLPTAAPTLPLSHPAQYRVIDSITSEGGRGPRRRELRPPTVTSAKGTPTPTHDPFMIYDAVQDLPEPTTSSFNPARILESISTSSKSRTKKETQEDELMQNFVPMLQEYLTLQQSAPQLGPSPDTTLPATESVLPPEEDAGMDDEVYDVYFRDLRENANAAATDVATLAGLQRIGALAGIVDDDLLSSELSSEDEDEADQDSNVSVMPEENDYRNDYPSSEDDGSVDSFRRGDFDDDSD